MLKPILDPQPHAIAFRGIEVPDDWQARLTVDVQRARGSVHITALSMLPPRGTTTGAWPLLWIALCDAARRGLHVAITLPAPQPAHPATASNASAATFAHAKGWHASLLPGPRLLHSKQFIIDKHIVWLGSANLTAAAFTHNHETYCRFISPAIALELLHRIDKLSSDNDAPN